MSLPDNLRKIVIATGNRHKYEEFRALLAPLGVELFFGKELNPDLDVEETGKTFVENATQKARAWAEATGLAALADDSGIEVRALDNRPGIYSARVGQDDESCRQWLLAQLEGQSDRQARFVASLVLLLPDGSFEWNTIQYCNGTVLHAKRGERGFGYDPLFVPQGENRSFGEMQSFEKAQYSHRALASKELVKMLRERFVIE